MGSNFEGDNVERSYEVYRRLAERASDESRPLHDGEIVAALSLALSAGAVEGLEPAAVVTPGPAPRTGDAL